jgi:hypothetical protein
MRQVLLTSALVVCEWSASRPGHFNPREEVPSTQWIGGWVRPTTGLERCGKKRNLVLTKIRTPSPRQYIPEPVTMPTVLSRLPYRTGWNFIYFFLCDSPFICKLYRYDTIQIRTFSKWCKITRGMKRSAQ